MKKLLSVFLVLLISLFLFAGCQKEDNQTSSNSTANPALSPTSEVSTGTEGVKVGDIAPAFSLQDMSGKSVDLSSFKGKKSVLIVFWASG